MTHTLTLNAHGHVRELVFTNPPNNHATVALLRDIADTLLSLDDDTDCRSIVLASDGKPFCAGADLVQAEGGGVGGSGDDPVREFYNEALRLYQSKKPVVAAVQGAAVGAGLGLAVFADFRIAAPEARFVANFTQLAFHPGFGLSTTLPRLLGAQKASLMLLTARRIKGEEALDWGLVDQLVPQDQLRNTALRLAAEIAEGGPLGVMATRRTLRRGLYEDVQATLDLEHAEQWLLRPTEDHAEGILAVAERRPGRFKAR
ncbi:MAG: enoyl-CoA hydratase/isomerase family protein [Hyphomonas sp.]|uniref:enoyl-CoA hydratase/isomerase family protein n=1 Tax=Hyphomonas sp. TaxID=87 RepID=UPI003527101B